MSIKALGELIASQRLSEEERERHHKTIVEFNELYQKFPIQTLDNTFWQGIKIHKTPTDLWLYQELIYALKPTVIIEVGEREGGSALYYADMMWLSNTFGVVLSIQQEGSQINEKAQKHLMVRVIEGDINSPVIKKLLQVYTSSYDKIMAIVNSVEAASICAEVVSVGMPLIIENECEKKIEQWVGEHPQFNSDMMCEKFMLTRNRGGFLERVY